MTYDPKNGGEYFALTDPTHKLYDPRLDHRCKEFDITIVELFEHDPAAYTENAERYREFRKNHPPPEEQTHSSVVVLRVNPDDRLEANNDSVETDRERGAEALRVHEHSEQEAEMAERVVEKKKWSITDRRIFWWVVGTVAAMFLLFIILGMALYIIFWPTRPPIPHYSMPITVGQETALEKSGCIVKPTFQQNSSVFAERLVSCPWGVNMNKIIADTK